MRHVIYLLVVMNLVYFSWNMLQNVPHKGGASLVGRIPPNVRRLETIQEHAEKSASAIEEDARVISKGPPVITDHTVNTEAQSATADINRAQTLTASEPPGAVAPSSNCHVLGPFTDDSEMKAVENRLNQLGYQPRERTSAVRVEDGYWVYLPAMEREEALRITRILEQNNDPDYLIMKDNRISLGVYDRPTRVDIRLKMLHNNGLEPVVESRYATQTAYWLDLDERDDDRNALKTIQGEYPDVEARDAACE
ncbi:MAG: hypothetical protein WCH04_03540 [Gammaproteobacteria bacterium]